MIEDDYTPLPANDTDPVAELAADLHIAVMRLARRLRAERRADIGSTQLGTLASVVRAGPVPMSELAAAEGVRGPSMTRTVACLEAEGLVSRAVDPDDGRRVLVVATDEGEAFIADVRRARRAWLADRLARVPEADRELLGRAAVLLSELVRQ
ncbi:MAG: MarR family winged helix-turn-helix transcriptional regulator [Candidatus Nanopelagicales bacterium]